MEQKKPRWEVKFEQYKQEGSKYEEMRKELKALKESKVTGDFKTKQEYQAAVDARNKEISEKEKLVQGYDNFKKNKGKIENILAYRNELQGKLENLPQDNKESIANKKAEIDKNETILAVQEQILDDLIQYVNSNPNSKDIIEKREDLGITAAVVRNLKEERAKLDGELQDLESVQKEYQEKVESKKATYERKIAKCNIIAANLLKGKELGEFEIKVVPEDKKFTSNDGKLTEEVEKARQEQETEKQEQTVVEEKAENSEPVVEESSVEEVYGEPEIIEDEIEEPEEDKAITKVSDFATKYPRLAKAGSFFKNMGNRASSFFKNIGSRLSNLFKKKEEELETVNAETAEEVDRKKFEEIERKAMTGEGLPKVKSFAEESVYLGLRSLYSEYRSGNMSRKEAGAEKEALRICYEDWTERERLHIRNLKRQQENIRRSEDLTGSIMRKLRDGARAEELVAECLACIGALTGNTVIEQMITEV